MLGEDDPLSAETWASGMLNVFDQARVQARLDDLEVPPFEEVLLERCRQRRDRYGLVVAAALAAVLGPPDDRLARSVVTDLRGAVPGAPRWIVSIGDVTATRAWIASDVFGDQDSLIVGYRQEGLAGEHALVVLVDHDLSGQAKDAWIGGDLDEVVGAWSSNDDPHMGMADVAVDVALHRLRDAVAMSDLWDGDADLRTDEFGEHRALIWSRLRRAGVADREPRPVETSPSEREHLVAEFLASPEAQGLSGQLLDADVEALAGHLVELRSASDGRPLRWSPNLVALLLGDLAPRKLLLDADQTMALPAVLRAFVRFSTRRTGLDGAFVDEILEAVDELEPGFLDAMGDPSAAGPAKAILAALQARGADLGDLEALTDALEQAPTRLPEPALKTRPSAAAASIEVVASAESSLALARFEALVAFYRDGRKLTQTGRPTLADARSLVDLLGTGDRLDPVIGDRTFKTRSAAELPELTFTIRWASVAGVLRKEHGRLRATTSWRKLSSEPLRRWLKSTDALTPLGPLAAYYRDARYRGRDEILDELGPQVLRLLVRQRTPFEEVLDWICEEADAMYEWLSPYMQEAEYRRLRFSSDLERWAGIFGWAGVVERVGATTEPDRYGGQRVVGGTLELTPVGRWWLGER